MKRTFSRVLLLVFIAALFPLRTSGADRISQRYTRRLPRIDKVELLWFRTRETWIESIRGIKILEGAEAQRIASLWRAQNLRSFSGICHNPVFGIRFFSKGKVILYASICWECHNIIVLEPNLTPHSKQGFAGESETGQLLLREFTQTFGM